MNYSIINSRLDSQLKKVTPNACRIVAPVLINDLNKVGVEKVESPTLINERKLKQVYHDVLFDIRTFDKKRKLPYHNVNHTINVYKRVVHLLKKSKLNKSDAMIVRIAALFHDYEHGIRDGKIPRDGLTFEERSAIKADKFVKKLGFSMNQRLKLYGAILSTTFSNPNIHPSTPMEKLLVIADLGGFMNTNERWLIESYHVTQEIPQLQRPATLKEWLGEQKKFLAYVSMRLPAEAKNLRWQNELTKKKKLIQRLLAKPGSQGQYKRIMSKITRAIEG